MDKDCKLYSFATFLCNGILSAIFLVMGFVAYCGSANTSPNTIVAACIWSVSGFAFVQGLVHLYILATNNLKE